MSTDKLNDIRGVLINVAGGRVLLPNANVAEIITFSDPEIVPNAPAWLLGRIRWRGWRLPLMSFSKFAGWSNDVAVLGTKVAVLKALGNNPKLPYFAVLSAGFPRLVTVSTTNLQEVHGLNADLPIGIYSKVLLNEDEAIVPDMLSVELMLDKALNQAA
jgi:chemosensory pili system protein ChpC